MPFISRVAHVAKEVVSPHFAFVDIGRDTARTVLVLASGRSGSTLLANLLNAGNRYRRMEEPFRRDRVRAGRAFAWGQYLNPIDDAPMHRRAARRILSGRARGTYIDFLNDRRLASRRIVKDIAATNLAPWFRRWFPEVPIVYLIRNPIAVTDSHVALEYPDRLHDLMGQPNLIDGQLGTVASFARTVAASSDPFARHALRWCLENAVPLRTLTVEDAHVVLYEHLVLDPEGELERVSAALGVPVDPNATDVARTPSHSDFRGRVGNRSPLALARESVTAVSDRDRRTVLDIVERFALDHLYGQQALPIVESVTVLRHHAGAVRRSVS